MENKNDRFDRYGTEGKMRNERQELTDQRLKVRKNMKGEVELMEVKGNEFEKGLEYK